MGETCTWSIVAKAQDGQSLELLRTFLGMLLTGREWYFETVSDEVLIGEYEKKIRTRVRELLEIGYGFAMYPDGRVELSLGDELGDKFHIDRMSELLSFLKSRLYPTISKRYRIARGEVWLVGFPEYLDTVGHSRLYFAEVRIGDSFEYHVTEVPLTMMDIVNKLLRGEARTTTLPSVDTEMLTSLGIAVGEVFLYYPVEVTNPEEASEKADEVVKMVDQFVREYRHYDVNGEVIVVTPVGHIVRLTNLIIVVRQDTDTLASITRMLVEKYGKALMIGVVYRRP